jgi:hypothetical protein
MFQAIYLFIALFSTNIFAETRFFEDNVRLDAGSILVLDQYQKKMGHEDDTYLLKMICYKQGKKTLCKYQSHENIDSSKSFKVDGKKIGL